MDQLDQSKEPLGQSMPNLTRKLCHGIQSLFRPRFKILAYHGVPNRNPSLYEVSSRQFQEQMRIIHEEGYEVLGLHNAVERMRNNDCPVKSIVITFDDAYESIFENAVPILNTFGFTATIFIPTGLVGTVDTLLKDTCTVRRFMSWRHLEELYTQGFSMGSHSVNHTNLLALDNDSLRTEIEESYRSLKAHFGAHVYYFAYPYGLLNEKVRNAIMASPFVGAVCFGSVLGNWAKTDPFLLKREKILATTSTAEFRKLIDPRYDLSRSVIAHSIKMLRRLVAQ